MAVGVRHHDTRLFLQLHLRTNMQIQTQFFSSQYSPNFRKCRISKKDGRDRRERWDGREIRDRGKRRGDSGIWNWRDREGTNGREEAEEEHEGERGETGKASLAGEMGKTRETGETSNRADKGTRDTGGAKEAGKT